MMSGKQGPYEQIKAIHDWKDADYYLALEDKLVRMSNVAIGDRTKSKLADEFIKMGWRWEFLRRHPDYQSGWIEASKDFELSNIKFGLFMNALDPFVDPHSIPLFASAAFSENREFRVSVSINPFRPLEPQFKLIKAMAAQLAARKEQFASHFDIPRSPSAISQKTAKHDYRGFIRVIDAVASNTHYREIAEILDLQGISKSGEKRFMGSLKQKLASAQKAQHAFTGLRKLDLSLTT